VSPYRRGGVLAAVQHVTPVKDSGNSGAERNGDSRPVGVVQVLGRELGGHLRVQAGDQVLEDTVHRVTAHGGVPQVPVRVDQAWQHDLAPVASITLQSLASISPATSAMRSPSMRTEPARKVPTAGSMLTTGAVADECSAWHIR